MVGLLYPGLDWGLRAPFIAQIPFVALSMISAVWLSGHFRVGWLTPLAFVSSAILGSIPLAATGYILPNILVMTSLPQCTNYLSSVWKTLSCLLMLSLSPIILGILTHGITCPLSGSPAQCPGVVYECPGFPPRALIDMTLPLAVSVGGVILACYSVSRAITPHRPPPGEP